MPSDLGISIGLDSSVRLEPGWTQRCNLLRRGRHLQGLVSVRNPASFRPSRHVETSRTSWCIGSLTDGDSPMHRTSSVRHHRGPRRCSKRSTLCRKKLWREAQSPSNGPSPKWVTNMDSCPTQRLSERQRFGRRSAGTMQRSHTTDAVTSGARNHDQNRLVLLR